MTVVLKQKHSLQGKSLLSLILEVKADQSERDTLARLKKDHPLERYSLEELKSEFNKLTGETIQSLVMIIGQEEILDLVRRIMNFSILHANNVGAPKGQPLTETSSSTSCSNSKLCFLVTFWLTTLDYDCCQVVLMYKS